MDWLLANGDRGRGDRKGYLLAEVAYRRHEADVAACDVLVVGAGSTGPVLPLWLTKLGAKVRIVDKTDAPGTTSRGLAVQARTLELYRKLDLAVAAVERTHKVPAINFWARGKREVRIPFEEVGAARTRYPYLKIFPQGEHERLLVARLEAEGVSVERPTELVEYADKGDRVVAVFTAPSAARRRAKPPSSSSLSRRRASSLSGQCLRST